MPEHGSVLKFYLCLRAYFHYFPKYSQHLLANVYGEVLIFSPQLQILQLIQRCWSNIEGQDSGFCLSAECSPPKLQLFQKQCIQKQHSGATNKKSSSLSVTTEANICTMAQGSIRCSQIVSNLVAYINTKIAQTVYYDFPKLFMHLDVK